MWETLPGFRAFYPEDCTIREYIFSAWEKAARCFNFKEYDAPILEPLELFTEKSGEEIAAQLFAFEDKGGRQVALRPEMTPSLARLVGAKANSLKRPIKWFNVGEHYRYERPQKGRLRAFYQFNADILGEEDSSADAEVIALAIHSLQRLGLTQEDFYVRLSDRQLWVLFLSSFTQEEAKIAQALGIIDKAERESPQKTQELLAQCFGDKANAIYEGILQLQGAHSLEAIVAILEKHGAGDALQRRLQDWQVLLGNLKSRGLMPYVKIDLSIVRGLLYYTGFVFEVFECQGKSRALAGGGRYDNLLEKLTGTPLPAVGFGMGDVTLRDLLEERQKLPKFKEQVDCFLVSMGEVERSCALEDLQKLRMLGYSAECDLKEGRPLPKQLKQADACNARCVLVYGEEEVRSGQVRVQNSFTRQAVTVKRSDLESVLKEILTPAA